MGSMQFTQGLHRAAQQRPDAIATACEGRLHSFSKLKDRISRLAGGLTNCGVRRGDRVAIYALNSDRYLEAYLAIAWIGAVAVPVNFRWSLPEVIYSLKDSECTAIFIDDQFAPHVESLLDECLFLRQVIYMGKAPLCVGGVRHEQLTVENEPIPDAEVGGDEIFGVFYTGGTTGAAKGVLLSHSNLCSSALALMAEGALADGAVGLHAAPMFHLADMMQTVILLLRGGEHVFLSTFKPELALELIEARKITDLLLVPAMLQTLADFPGVQQRETKSVQRIMYGASPISEAVLERAMTALPSADFMQVYGMTEMSAVMTVLTFSQHSDLRRNQVRLRSGGRSAYHVQVRIVDEKDNELPRGQVGEIIANGPNVMQGYLNKPETTESALKNGWMHTGDMGYMDNDGFVYIVDRLKDMIISGGENIYCVEVENAIAQHPSVAAVAVIGIPCNDMGEKVHAAVVLRPGTTLTQDNLYSHCKALIAGYKCPRSLEIRDSLPISGAGKVLKTELRRPHWQNLERAVA